MNSAFLATLACLAALLAVTESRVMQAYVVDANHNVMKKFVGREHREELATIPLCYYLPINASRIQPTKLSNLTWADYKGMLNRKNSTALLVQLAMQLLQVTDVSEREQTVSLVVETTITWADCRLRWTKEESDIPSVTLPPQKFKKLDIFVPLMRLLEATNPHADVDSETVVTIFSNGELFLSREFSPIISCNINVRMYPFDVQYCNITFESAIEEGLVSFNYREANSVLEESNYLLGSGRYLASDTWSVTLFPPDRVKRSICSNLHNNASACFRNGLRFALVLRRHPMYQLINLVFPAFLVVVISSCVFIMPPDTEDKMGLCVTILLSMFMFTQLMYEKMPDTGSVVPILSEYFMVCIGLVGCSCVFSAFNTLVEYACPIVPLWLRRVVRCLAPVVMFELVQPRKRNSAPKSPEVALLNPANDSRCNRDLPEEEQRGEEGGFNVHKLDEIGWRSVSALADRFFFVLHLVTSSAILAIFLSYGYFEWYHYAEDFGERQKQFVCTQLQIQQDEFAHNVCGEDH